MFLRKYGTGTGADVIIPIIKRGVVDFAVSADWTPASGDVKVSKDGGTEANIGTLPVINGTAGWKFVFSDAELQCKSLTVRIVDSATKAIEDQFFIVETYGNASAMFQSDLAAAQIAANVTHFGGTAGTFADGRPEVNTTHWGGTVVGSVTINCNMTQISGDSGAADNAESFFDGTGYAGTNNVIPTVTTVTNGVTVDTNSIDDIVDRVWDEVLTGATHNVPSSAGRRLRQLASVIVHSGTAQGPGTDGNQIQLDTGASATNGAYDPGLIYIESGTGAGQARLILQYNGTTKVATVDRDWRVNPDNTSEFVIIGDAGRQSVNEGLAQGGTATTITLNANASSDDDAYNGQLVFIRSGLGQDQVALVEDYVGSTKVATIRTRAANGQWAVTPDTTSAYVMLPNLTWTIDEIQYGLATATELAKVPKQGETRRYTQVAADSGNKTADVSIGGAL